MLRGSILALMAALLLSGSIAAACGGGSSSDSQPLTLEEYFPAVKAVMDNMEADANVVESDMQGAIDNATQMGQLLTALSDGLQQFIDVADSAATELNTITAPPEAESQHRELVALVNTTSSTLQDILADVGEIDPEDNEDVILEQVREVAQTIQTEVGSLNTQGDVNCREMQSIADENSVEVDLGCNN